MSVSLKQKNRTISHLKTEVIKLEKSLAEKDTQIEELQKTLSKIFTKSEVKILSGKVNNYVHYGEEEMEKAVTLHTMSNKAYDFLRELGYPFPSLSTVKRWLQKVEVVPGKVISPVLRVIKKKVEGANWNDTVCAIALDEIKIDPKYCYDVQSDSVLGGHNEGCVVTVRGILEPWKYIVHFEWIKNPSYLDWMQILKALSDVGLDVRAHVSDMGTRNQRLWKLLEVGKVEKGEIQETWYLNNSTGKRIWIFPDFPHLLKLLRNHSIDDGIYLESGGVFNKELIEKLIKIQRDEFKLTPALTHRHVYLKGQQSQNVGTAFQLFSSKVSSALKTLLPHSSNEADFVQLVNDFSDLMNSRIANYNHHFAKSPYGMSFGEQENLLNKAFQTFSSMKVGIRKRRTYAPFQKGLLIHIVSLRGLFKELRQEHNVKYILTSRLNQDYLENIFSQIRGMGRLHATPTALEFQYRVKRVICSNILFVPKTASVEPDLDVSEKFNYFHELIRTDESIPQVYTRESNKESNVERILDKLTDLEWNVESEVATLNSLGYNQRSEEGGKEFVAGYITKRFLLDHPEMSRSGSGETESGFWIQNLSKFEAGLCEPSVLWLNQFKKVEDVFQILFGSGNNFFVGGVVSELFSMLRRNFKQFPEDVLKYYARLRVLLRVQYLNKKLEDDRFKLQEIKRKARENKQNQDEEDEEETISLADMRELETEDFERNLNEADALIEQLRF